MRPVRFLLLLPLGIALGALGISFLDNSLRDAPQALTGVTELKIAEAMREGWNIGLTTLPNERLVRRYYLLGDFKKPDVVVFGSSRSNSMFEESWPGESFYNLSINGGALEDDMALNHLLRERGARPRKTVICCDPWLLGHHDVLPGYKPNEDYYFKALESLVQEGRIPAEILRQHRDKQQKGAWFRHLNFLRIRNCLDYYLYDFLHPIILLKTVENSRRIVYRNSGTMVAEQRFNHLDPVEVRDLAVASLEKASARVPFGTFPLDDDQERVFQGWVDSMLKEGGKVYFYLGPFHPAIYPALVRNPENSLVAAETRFRKIASTRNVEVLGSYNPEVANIPIDDFMDGSHIQPRGMSRILDQRSR